MMHSVSIARETAFRRTVKLTLWLAVLLLLLTAVAAAGGTLGHLVVASA